MPKSPSSSPSNSNTHSKQQSPDDPSTRMSDVALRKKKNADAQAAFRARRANYIATLEETVTSLESVVLQLQDSCREARNESQELRQENARLKHEYREREKFWRALWQSRKTGQGLESDDLPSFPSTFPVSQMPGSTGHTGSTSISQFPNDNIAFRNEDSSCQVSYSSTSVAYPAHSPSLPYSSPDSNVPSDLPSHQRLTKFNAYPYGVHPPARDSRWQAQPLTQTSSSSGDSATMASNPSTHSPAYAESPTLTSSDMPYVGRFPADDTKLGVATLESAPYVFPSSLPHSRSMSPTNSNHGSSSSTSLTSFQFTFGENPNSIVQDRADFDYRRHSLQHSTEMTLHGGTADISITPASGDAARYRLGGLQRVEQGQDAPQASTGPVAGSDNGSQHERGSSDGDGINELYSRVGARNDAVPSQSSRSPSPSTPAISCTVAVIKAHAFGALRRTRTRSKRSSEGAAKVALDVLESRGIGTSVVAGSKRSRLQEDDLELEET